MPTRAATTALRCRRSTSHVFPTAYTSGRAVAAANLWRPYHLTTTTTGSSSECRRQHSGETHPGLAVVRSVRPTTGDDASAWIKQSMEDYHSKRGEGMQYRSSAAWALRQMDDRFSILREGQVVVDLGCFSGGWSQVAIERTEASSSVGGGKVIGIDRVRGEPLDNHVFIQGDVGEPQTVEKILHELGDRRADIVLSDVAPARVGLKVEDHLDSAQCCLWAANIMERSLRLGGWFVVKMLYGPESNNFRLYLNTRFELVRTIRPPSSRQVWREMFFVCRGFIGRAPIAEEIGAQGNFGTKHEGVDRWSANIRSWKRL